MDTVVLKQMCIFVSHLLHKGTASPMGKCKPLHTVGTVWVYSVSRSTPLFFCLQSDIIVFLYCCCVLYSVGMCLNGKSKLLSPVSGDTEILTLLDNAVKPGPLHQLGYNPRPDHITGMCYE